MLAPLGSVSVHWQIDDHLRSWMFEQPLPLAGSTTIGSRPFLRELLRNISAISLLMTAWNHSRAKPRARARARNRSRSCDLPPAPAAGGFRAVERELCVEGAVGVAAPIGEQLFTRPSRVVVRRKRAGMI